MYHLLADNNLHTYYDLDSTPGTTIKQSIERKRFDYLIDKDVQDKLIDFKNAEVASTSFNIPNIHCTSCVWLLENLQNLNYIPKKDLKFYRSLFLLLIKHMEF